MRQLPAMLLMGQLVLSTFWFLACREMLYHGLRRAGQTVRFTSRGLPGYPERVYDRAPSEVRRTLARRFRIYRVSLWIVVTSMVACPAGLLLVVVTTSAS